MLKALTLPGQPLLLLAILLCHAVLTPFTAYTDTRIFFVEGLVLPVKPGTTTLMGESSFTMLSQSVGAVVSIPAMMLGGKAVSSMMSEDFKRKHPTMASILPTIGGGVLAAASWFAVSSIVKRARMSTRIKALEINEQREKAAAAAKEAADGKTATKVASEGADTSTASKLKGAVGNVIDSAEDVAPKVVKNVATSLK